MEIYYIVIFFILGTILGSFYNVVGYRIPKGESIIYPGSHCPNCNHKLKPIELIPILSFLMQKGKCKNCHQKISWFYPIFEFISGVLFSLSYMSYGLTLELLIVLTFISLMIIIVISDYHYLIIPDSVLLVFILLLLSEIFFINGFNSLIHSIFNGLICFGVMFLIKVFGDFIFKKESMGGGDIKLMFVFGLIFDIPVALFSIFLASLIGLPISLFIVFKNKSHIIPFGPFLCTAAIILLLGHVDTTFIYNLFIR